MAVYFIIALKIQNYFILNLTSELFCRQSYIFVSIKKTASGIFGGSLLTKMQRVFMRKLLPSEKGIRIIRNLLNRYQQRMDKLEALYLYGIIE